MTSVNILTQALLQYAGTYVVVSHDRHFVRNIANKIWYIEDQQIKEYPGTYEEFVTWSMKREKPLHEAPTRKPEPVAVQASVKTEKKTDNRNLAELKNFRKELEKSEKLMEELEGKKSKLETEMSKPENYANLEKLAELNKEFVSVSSALEKVTQDWENLYTRIEKIESENN
jgi:ATP-binding cassette subfamily F protein 3